MKPARFGKIARLLSLPLVVMLVLGAMGGGAGKVVAEHAAMPSHGMVCTTNPTATFTLTTKEGTISTPDGNIVYMWGFSEGDSPFQHPGPVLCVNEGDTVTVVLNNTLEHDVSIIFPGQENVLADGLPSQPVFDGGGNLISLAPVAEASGGSVTYQFVATRPGTYLYESGTESAVQVNMGLFGALIVRPALHPDWAYNEVVEAGGETYTTAFTPDEEFVMLLSEIDPMLHMAVEQGLPYNMNNYRSRYWMINGRSFPDTIAPNGAEWLPNQPYSSLVHINPFNDSVAPDDPAYHPSPALIRYLSVGTEDYPHHPHGNHGRLIARDGNVLISGGEDLSYEKFTVVVGPGETVDELFAWWDVEQWDPVTNPIPVTIPQLQNLTFGTFYSGSPYLGNLDTLPVGHQVLNACGEYYHISHNHALQQITAWGIVLSGHITFTRIDPPLPNDCP
ncbi:MAG: multicopper oxidase domain-containing protein [Anaerolineaceae bacterium]|nr:multicopper oxidase domain-containing protein [Anaerolineaceae bacterium]